MDAPRAGGRTSSGYFTCRKHILSEKKGNHTQAGQKYHNRCIKETNGPLALTEITKSGWTIKIESILNTTSAFFFFMYFSNHLTLKSYTIKHYVD
jgi:hypothetical protein